MKRRVIAAAVVAAAALLVGGVMSISAVASGPDSGASPSGPPPRPPWVNVDGTVDSSKMPATVPVVGPDGKPLKDAKGREVRVDPRSFEPGKAPSKAGRAAPSGKQAAPTEKRWTEIDENGRTVEHVQVEPTVPASVN